MVSCHCDVRRGSYIMASSRHCRSGCVAHVFTSRCPGSVEKSTEGSRLLNSSLAFIKVLWLLQPAMMERCGADGARARTVSLAVLSLQQTTHHYTETHWGKPTLHLTNYHDSSRSDCLKSPAIWAWFSAIVCLNNALKWISDAPRSTC